MKWGISKATQVNISQQKATTSAVSQIPSSLPIHAPYSLRNCVSLYTLRRITRTKRHPAQPTASSRCFVSSFSCQWLTHLLLGVRRKVFVFTVPTQKNKQTSCFSLLFIYLFTCFQVRRGAAQWIRQHRIDLRYFCFRHIAPPPFGLRQVTWRACGHLEFLRKSLLLKTRMRVKVRGLAHESGVFFFFFCSVFHFVWKINVRK